VSHRHLDRLALLVEIVTDIVMGSNGVATSQGTHLLGEDDGHPLESETAWHFGFYSRPKDGARGVVLKADGEGNTSFLFCFRDKQYELSLEKGEVGAKNAFNAYWLLNKNGVLELNGTDYALPKWDDFLTDFKTLVDGIDHIVATGLVKTDFTAAWTAMTAKLTGGNYKSQKAKNG
jgi:phage gp45-like